MTPMAPVLSTTRAERWTVLGLTLIAAVLRFWGFGRLGLSHFDEGVYAASGFWVLSPKGLGALDPQVIPYAPGGFPVLIGLAYVVLGVSDISALLVPAILGVLTVPVVAWVGRRTFGKGAGVAAATLVTFSIAHVAFSRKALTDVPFLLAWVLALGLGGWFLERPRLGRALALGCVVGLAQNLKYNGYLAGGLVALAAVVGVAVDREARSRDTLLRTFGFGLIAALVALAVYWPWFQFVEDHGGYAGLLRHHRSYLGGLRSWYPHWEHQRAQVVALSGGFPWQVMVWSIAWAGTALVVNGPGLVVGSGPEGWSRFRMGWLFGSATLAVLPDLPWWVGLTWSPWLLTEKRPAVRLLGVWWIVLSIMTPFYHPYARLWLPLHAAGWLLMTGLVVRLGPFPPPTGNAQGLTARKRPGILVGVAAGIACLLIVKSLASPDLPRPFPLSSFFTPTNALRNSIHNLVAKSSFPVDRGVLLRVFARRPVAFYLSLHRGVPFRLVADRNEVLQGPGGSNDWVLVDEVLLSESLSEGAEWTRVARKWARASTWDESLDPLTDLDVNPASAYTSGRLDDVKLVLYRPRGGTPAEPSH